MTEPTRIVRLAATVSILALVGFAALPAAAALPTPQEHFGFAPGDDGRLMDYDQLIAYLELADRASDRIDLRPIGESPMERPMYVLFVSSEENISRLDELQAINRRLALDGEIPEAERQDLVDRGAVFVMETLSMHSTEVGPSQSLPLMVHDLVTTRDEAVLEQLGDVVLMFVPCHNPDGMDMVVDHYREYAGTKYDGSSLPGIYHRYVGHDNNRDFVALTQSDTRAIARVYNTEWYPQVLVEKHQMGRTGPRYYVPANHDPIAENIDAGLWHWSAVFGSNLSKDMAADGLTGVASHWTFDNYWPGSTETSHWKNVISFLTEASSCRVASPVFIERTELSVRGKGLSEYKKSVNMPEPWPGGWWRLSDIVAYELSSMRSILHTASMNRAEILAFRNDLCREEIDRGRTEAPFYYIFPAAQHDSGERVALVELLLEHGVEVYELERRVEAFGRVFEAGDVVVPLAQPYRPFVKEALEMQRFPERHYTPGGDLIKPYDITSWSLPLHRGVISMEIDARSAELEDALIAVDGEWAANQRSFTLPDTYWGLAYPAGDNLSFRAAFLALARGLEVGRLLEADGDLPAGSFFIRGTSSKIADLANEVGLPPVVLTQAPAAPTAPQRSPRIGLIETWFHDMDAGWTRFVLDSYGVEFEVLRPGDIKDVDLAKDFDVLLFPDANKDVLISGRYKNENRYYRRDYPPDYTKGLGKEGIAKLVAFLDGGGIVVSSRGSTGVFLDGLEAQNEGSEEKEKVQLPARDVSKSLKEKGLYVPGAVLRANFITDHPLTWGVPAEMGVFSRGDPVFATRIPDTDTDRRVIATYAEKDVLLSGYLDGEKLLSDKPVMVWLRRGKGQMVLFGFIPQFRSSMPATYKLLFNALLLPEWEK